MLLSCPISARGSMALTLPWLVPSLHKATVALEEGGWVAGEGSPQLPSWKAQRTLCDRGTPGQRVRGWRGVERASK